jgi:hypothetical protein
MISLANSQRRYSVKEAETNSAVSRIVPVTGASNTLFIYFTEFGYPVSQERMLQRYIRRTVRLRTMYENVLDLRATTYKYLIFMYRSGKMMFSAGVVLVLVHKLPHVEVARGYYNMS